MASDGHRRHWVHLALIAALWLGLRWGLEAWLRMSEPLGFAPGIELKDVAPSPGWERSGYTIVPIKRCRIRARVLGQEPYYSATLSDIAPSDLMLGWGPLADEGVLGWLSVSQHGRGYSWSYKSAPVEQEEIAGHLANMMVIPASPLLGYRARAVKSGDVVSVEGYVVNVTDPNGAKRLSPGIFSQEIEMVWVEKLAIQ